MARGTGTATREAVVAAAARCFARSGYQGTSTAQIAAEAAVSEGTLFNHFGSKQGLLVAAMERARRIVEARLAAPSGAGGNGVADFAERALGLLLDPAFSEITRLRAFALALTDEPDVADALRAGRTEIHDVLAAALRSAQAAGDVRPDLNADDLADVAMGYSYEAAVVMTIDPARAPERITSVVRTLVESLRAHVGGSEFHDG